MTFSVDFHHTLPSLYVRNVTKTFRIIHLYLSTLLPVCNCTLLNYRPNVRLHKSNVIKRMAKDNLWLSVWLDVAFPAVFDKRLLGCSCDSNW